MLKIHAQTHRFISTNLYQHVNDIYDIELNYDRLVWGSVAPDILPKYKLYRHYYENSIDYIILRIAKLIFAHRLLDFSNCNSLSLKILSRDMGIISHYLADFTCRAHADRLSTPKSLVKHLKYEIELNDIAKIHDFDTKIIKCSLIEFKNNNLLYTLPIIKFYIAEVIKEYLEEESFERDLDYALALNKAVFEYIIESIIEYNTNTDLVYNF